MKEDNKKQKKKSQSKTAWLVTVFIASLLVSASFSFFSQKLLGGGSMFAGFVVLLAIIAIGILFDMLGVSVTAADEKPFHSMASRKVPGATEAIRLLRNAGKVSSICCDIVGDICGVISGAAAALIAVEAFTKLHRRRLREGSRAGNGKTPGPRGRAGNGKTPGPGGEEDN